MIKIIHQTWRDHNIPHDIYPKSWQDSWKNDYPDWEYKFWTDDDNDNLVNKGYREYYDFYKQMTRGVVKSDFARLLYLHCYGGLYVDMDFISLKNISKIIQTVVDDDWNFIVGSHANKSQPLPNAWMYSERGNTFPLKVIESGIQAVAGGIKKVEAMFGPDTLARVVSENPQSVFKLPYGSVYPAVWGAAGSHTWDVNTDWSNIDSIKATYPDSFAVTKWTHTGKEMKIHQIWIGNAKMPKRYQAYCDTVKKYMPKAQYTLWDEESIQSLKDGCVIPECLDTSLNPILRADILRLEILRQHGGLYLDVDFEFLRFGAEDVFEGCDFVYSDHQWGQPANALLYAGDIDNFFITLLLKRIKRTANLLVQNHGGVVNETGPKKLADCLWYYVGDWSKKSEHIVSGEHVGNHYADGEITALIEDFFVPYKVNEDTWATFDPLKYPKAYAAHHHHQIRG